jgi:hypothetical protein
MRAVSPGKDSARVRASEDQTMSQGAGTVTTEIDARDIRTSLQFKVKVRGKSRALWRVKIAATIVAVAARILGGTVDLEAELR